MRTIRASEIGTYLYCKRAWWYQQQGLENINQSELQSGGSFHHQHGNKVLTAGLMRLAGWGLLLAGVTLLAIALTLRWVG